MSQRSSRVNGSMSQLTDKRARFFTKIIPISLTFLSRPWAMESMTGARAVEGLSYKKVGDVYRLAQG